MNEADGDRPVHRGYSSSLALLDRPNTTRQNCQTVRRAIDSAGFDGEGNRSRQLWEWTSSMEIAVFIVTTQRYTILPTARGYHTSRHPAVRHGCAMGVQRGPRHASTQIRQLAATVPFVGHALACPAELCPACVSKRRYANFCKQALDKQMQHVEQ